MIVRRCSCFFRFQPDTTRNQRVTAKPNRHQKLCKTIHRCKTKTSIISKCEIKHTCVEIGNELVREILEYFVGANVVERFCFMDKLATQWTAVLGSQVLNQTTSTNCNTRHGSAITYRVQRKITAHVKFDVSTLVMCYNF